MTPRRYLYLAIACALALPAGAASAAAEAKAVEDAKPAKAEAPAKEQSPAKAEAPERKMNLRQVTRELADEGREAAKADYLWPRDKPTYATEKGLTFESKDVIRELCRRQDRNPAIDGYVKLQLLSFNPAIPEITGSDAGRIIASMPAYMPDAAPSKRDLNFLKGYSKARRASAAEQEHGRGILTTMRQEQLTVDKANRPTTAYRTQLIGLLPDDGGIRLLARIQDMEDRLAAGQSSRDMKKIIDAVSSDCSRLRADPALPMGVRKLLIRKLTQIGQMESSKLENVGILANGNMVCGFRSAVPNSKVLAPMLANLEGKEYEEPKKK